MLHPVAAAAKDIIRRSLLSAVIRAQPVDNLRGSAAKRVSVTFWQETGSVLLCEMELLHTSLPPKRSERVIFFSFWGGFFLLQCSSMKHICI